MLSILIMPAILFAATLLAGAGICQKQQVDQERIQGTWYVVSVQESGETQTFDDAPRLTVNDDTIVVTPMQGERITLTYRVAPKQCPKAIDISHEIDSGGPIVQLGIYSLDDNQLNLCVAGAGQPRPARFDSDVGIVLTLRRER
jgi:uncharacterized protein (TIGR03067 family)